jgi:HSP20 family protein
MNRGQHEQMEHYNRWMDLAQQFHSDHFWNQVFSNNESAFQAASSANPFAVAHEYFPKCDLYEDIGMLVLEVEVPGLKKDDIHIALKEQILTLSGEFRSLKPKRKYFIKERANLKFKKEFTLPFPVVLQNSSSDICNGVLTIKMPIDHEEMEDISITLDEQNN